MPALTSFAERSLIPRCRKATTILGLSAALGLGLAAPAPAPAATLADNLNEPSSGLSLVIENDTALFSQVWQGMKFNNTSVSIVNSVTVRLANPQGTSTGNVVFDIYNETAGLPGTSVGTVGSLATSSITAGFANYTFSSLALALNANSTYFLIGRPVGFATNTGNGDLNPPRSISWAYTTSDNGFGYTPPERVRSTNGGTSFISTTNSQNLVLQITATVPGPLPLLGGAAAFGWSRRMRQRLRAARKVADHVSHGA